MPQLKSATDVDDLTGTMSDPGYAYVITSQHGTKVGISTCPESRLYSIRVSVPFEITLAIVIPTRNMIKLERELHKKFASKRIMGEWFSLDDCDLIWLRTLVPDGFVIPKAKKKQKPTQAEDCPF